VSGTEYARNKILRIDEQDRQVLYRAVMRSIELVSAAQPDPQARFAGARETELRNLRSLLDRLEEL